MRYSVIVPVNNEEGNISQLDKEIKAGVISGPLAGILFRLLSIHVDIITLLQYLRNWGNA